MLYVACTLLVAIQVATFTTWRPAWGSALVMLEGVAVFTLLAYAGQRTQLQVSGSVSETLGTAVHIAAILLFPPPFPVLIALMGALSSQILHVAGAPLYKRAFNICHPTLTVGLSGFVCSLVVAPTTLLRPGHILPVLPILTLLIAVYYILDVGTMLGVLALIQAQTPWRVWRHTYRRTLLPELATSTIGIIATVAWQYDPILVALFVLPVIALGVAFRAIAAEGRAAALRRRGEQLETVLAAGQRLRLQHTQADLLHPLIEAARSLTGARFVAAYLRTEEDPPMLERVVLVPPDAEGAGPARFPVPSLDEPLPYREGERGVLLVPLELEGVGVAGMLWLGHVPGELGQDDRDVLAILATQGAIALQNAQLHERALAQASEDGLTGLLNHRAFQTHLDKEVTWAHKGVHALALMMVDLDNFGAINNTFGHQAGDAALMAVADTLRTSLRATDVAARYGGDEFAVILPYTTAVEAEEIAQRILAAITGMIVPAGEARMRIGASIGVAAFPQHAASRESLVRMADQAAYAAKHAGKGRVSRAEDGAVPVDRDPAALMAMLEHANLATVEALAAAVDAKDSYTRGHSQRVSIYAVALATAMELPDAEIARARLAGLLHDVGKIGVPDEILTKTGNLSAEEYALLQQHPVIGERMLSGVPFLHEILPAVRHHHERWDGCGYPDGLAAAAIPRDAAILGVADALDAMTSSRTYRPALPLGEATRRVREGSGTHFDPRVVAAFERALADGTLTVLSAEAPVTDLRALAS